MAFYGPLIDKKILLKARNFILKFILLKPRKIILYRLSRPLSKKKCSEGKRGVPGVPLSKLLLYINNLSMFLGCPYGVPMVSLRDT
tara:strand:+ start:301 stop:558 length:258 start_codon:yes stop_codon:yes gene_type:complete